MTVAVRPLPIRDFTGGFTDNYVDAPSNQGQIIDNFIILEDKSIRTRYGSHVEDAVNAPIIPAGQQRIGQLINYDKDDKLFVQSADKLYFRDPSSYSTLQGPSSNDIFPTATTTNHIAHSEWKKHVFVTCDNFETPKKFYRDDGGTYQLRTAGLPDLASNPTITPGAAGARVYLYTFHYHYTYKAGQEEFQDFGPTTVIEVENSDDPSSSANSITGIPVLSNGSSESYDTSNIKVYIFRSIDGDDTLYKIGEVTNGTTTFNDNNADTDIETNEVVYTTGDVLDNDTPPLAKYVHVVNNTGYYAHLKEGTETLVSDVLQSAFNDPDSVPNQNRISVDDEIKGMHSVQSIPMVFCRKHIYRIEGAFDDLGKGTPTAIRINDTAGCVSNKSIVFAKDFVFWAGNDKFYASDGYKVVPISDHFHERYKSMLDAMSDAANIVGVYDEKAERIYWSLQTDSGSADNDSLWVLDLRWGISKNSSFTSHSGGTSFAPTAISIFNDELVRADRRGYVFIHSDDDTDDPKVDTTQSPDDWTVQPIEYLYKGFATNFGTDALRKWVTRLYMTAKNITNVSIGITAINDDGKLERTFTPIRYRKNLVWGDPEFTWGDADCVWNASGLIQQMRRFPRRGIRCSYLQMQIDNSKTVVTNSDNLGTATVSGTVVTLDTVGNEWPLQSIDYYIAFENDGYVNEFLITEQTATTLTFLDTQSLAPTGSLKWVLRGIRKGEVLNLVAYTLSYLPISQSQSMFEAGQSGENA